jgi:hypothetical protein
MPRLLLGIAIVAALSAAGDYIWYEFGVEHRMWVGIAHGAALLAAVGGTLGAATGRAAAGMPVGAAAGIVGALTYYALAPLLGNVAMIAAWTVLWIVLAVADARIVRRGQRSFGQSLAQGASAALLSGVTFYLVVGSLWGRPPAGGRNYAIQFALWSIAWAPGILAIGQELRRRGQSKT